MAAGSSGYLLAGLGNVAAPGETRAYKGRVTRIDGSGNLLWNISITADGIDSTIIYTECWGVDASGGVCTHAPRASDGVRGVERDSD